MWAGCRKLALPFACPGTFLLGPVPHGEENRQSPGKDTSLPTGRDPSHQASTQPDGLFEETARTVCPAGRAPRQLQRAWSHQNVGQSLGQPWERLTLLPVILPPETNPLEGDSPRPSRPSAGSRKRG